MFSFLYSAVVAVLIFSFFIFNGGVGALLIFVNFDLCSWHSHLSVRPVVLNTSYVGGNDLEAMTAGLFI